MSIATDYFRGQAGVLDSKYRSSVIKNQNPDTGFNREEFFRDWLSQHLPQSVTPELGGKIIDAHGNSTNQVDIVIYNDNVPRFGGNPKSYYFAEGVVAAIQVKSNLNSGMLKDAIDNLDTVKKCKVRPPAGLTFGEPSDEILTGIFAYDTDYSSSDAMIEALNKHMKQGKKPANFICVNRKWFIVNNKGEWQYTDDTNTKTLLPLGYIAPDKSEECIFRMVLALSSEAKKNLATAIDFQPYFLDGWEK